MHDSIQLTKTTSSRGTSISRSSRRQRGIVRLLVVAPTLAFLLLTSPTAFGGSATWNLNPIDGNWFNAANWTPATVPNGPADTATFGVSNITGVSLALCIDDIEVNGIVFDAGASAFTFTVSNFCSFTEHVIISGVGITNNSGITQSFVLPPAEEDSLIQFTNNATAGNLTSFTTDQGGKNIEFHDTSTAGEATLIANTFPNESGGGAIEFHDTSTAGEATLIANSIPNQSGGGAILFFGDSTGGTARVEVFGDGSLDVSAHNAPGVTTGSIEGDGQVHLGANNLTVGSNNLSTKFSGVIRGGGSLTKIGTGKLTLSGSNKYAGGTIVNDGTLLVNNKRTSGTGKRPVQVNAGTLGGTGTIGGEVTIGTGSGSGAFLSPGVDATSHRTLTLRNTLMFNSDGTYKCGFNSGTARTDKVIAMGVTINSGAQFSFQDSQATTLPLGTVFTVIDNTAATSIAGTFINLADGSTITVGSNTFQASYEGGDGNDLTLTVVP